MQKDKHLIRITVIHSVWLIKYGVLYLHGEFFHCVEWIKLHVYSPYLDVVCHTFDQMQRLQLHNFLFIQVLFFYIIFFLIMKKENIIYTLETC